MQSCWKAPSRGCQCIVSKKRVVCMFECVDSQKQIPFLALPCLSHPFINLKTVYSSQPCLLRALASHAIWRSTSLIWPAKPAGTRLTLPVVFADNAEGGYRPSDAVLGTDLSSMTRTGQNPAKSKAETRIVQCLITLWLRGIFSLSQCVLFFYCFSFAEEFPLEGTECAHQNYHARALKSINTAE